MFQTHKKTGISNKHEGSGYKHSCAVMLPALATRYPHFICSQNILGQSMFVHFQCGFISPLLLPNLLMRQYFMILFFTNLISSFIRLTLQSPIFLLPIQSFNKCLHLQCEFIPSFKKDNTFLQYAIKTKISQYIA